MVLVLGDMSVDGDADVAVTVRICSGWFKFTSLASFQSGRWQWPDVVKGD